MAIGIEDFIYSNYCIWSLQSLAKPAFLLVDLGILPALDSRKDLGLSLTNSRQGHYKLTFYELLDQACNSFVFV